MKHGRDRDGRSGFWPKSVAQPLHAVAADVTKQGER
jgi:hypothetical protein